MTLNFIYKNIKNIIKIFYNPNAVFSGYFENYNDLNNKLLKIKAYTSSDTKFLKKNEIKIEPRHMISIRELKKKNVNILEIGSGNRFTSLILEKLNIRIKTKNYLLETKTVINSLKKTIPKYYKRNHFFYDNIKNIPNIKYDIAIFNSSIQYIHNLEYFLNKLFKKKISTIVITETLITKKSKDFYILQSYHNYKIIYHVISLTKLIDLFKRNNFYLVSQNLYNYEKNIFSCGLYSKVELINLIFKRH